MSPKCAFSESEDRGRLGSRFTNPSIARACHSAAYRGDTRDGLQLAEQLLGAPDGAGRPTSSSTVRAMRTLIAVLLSLIGRRPARPNLCDPLDHPARTRRPAFAGGQSFFRAEDDADQWITHDIDALPRRPLFRPRVRIAADGRA